MNHGVIVAAQKQDIQHRAGEVAASAQPEPRRGKERAQTAHSAAPRLKKSAPSEPQSVMSATESTRFIVRPPRCARAAPVPRR